MPRPKRCVLPGTPCHITQRGVDRRETFSSTTDRQAYIRLLQENRDDAGVSLLGWCLMTNHVHLIALPVREDSLSIFFRRVSRALRAILQRLRRPQRTSLAKSLLRLRPGAGPSLDGPRLCGAQPGARGNGRPSARLPMVPPPLISPARTNTIFSIGSGGTAKGMPIGNSISSRLRASPTKPCGPVPMPAGPLEVKPTCKKWPRVSTVTGRRADLRKTRRPAAHQSRISSLYFEETHSSKQPSPPRLTPFPLDTFSFDTFSFDTFSFVQADTFSHIFSRVL
jgi:REP element-mobilizing transposase RayT